MLRMCIPGCDKLETSSPTDMTAAGTLKVGPVKAMHKDAPSLLKRGAIDLLVAAPFLVTACLLFSSLAELEG
jgi:hypothetical protein